MKLSLKLLRQGSQDKAAHAYLRLLVGDAAKHVVHNGLVYGVVNVHRRHDGVSTGSNTHSARGGKINKNLVMLYNLSFCLSPQPLIQQAKWGINLSITKKMSVF